MSLLYLEDVGKIYVSDGSVAVGIRHVTLDFDIGEFVAVTGKSGSGKTTLLNVISGMDTYEEGELYVQGEPTSHYSQADFELYREKYISFIFQDYNIIDSFTVLQNVELALSDIADKRARRARALELIERVGLSKFRHHRGSKLSGGQKQRTVIARALAKDSPIILADEPTGNLDAASSAEIIALLAEIAKEKLVIVVTHSAQQLQAYATREIRIFDGGVERDEILRDAPKGELILPEKKEGKARTWRRSAELGAHRFRAVPKLSAFMCILMIIAMLATFFATALTVTNLEPIGAEPMFTHLPGRVVLVRQDAEPMTDAELEALAAKVGAASALHFDALLDHRTAISYRMEQPRWRYYSVPLAYSNNKALTPDVGRLPETKYEALLELPIEFQPIFGKETLLRDYIRLYGGGVHLSVVGVRYYYDNTRPYGNIFLTQEGFEYMSAVDYLCGGQWNSEMSFSLEFNFLTNGNPNTMQVESKNVAVDANLTGNQVAWVEGTHKVVEQALGRADSYTVNLLFGQREYNRYNDSYTVTSTAVEGVDFDPKRTSLLISDYGATDDDVYIYAQQGFGGIGNDVIVDSVNGNYYLAISPELAMQLMHQVRDDSYTQASLFFEDDDAAEAALETIREAGYLPVLSSSTYVSADSLLFALLEGVLMWAVWLVLVVFFAIFVALCSTRAMAAKRGDLAILRSMGIPNRIIKRSSYVQTALSLIPAILLLFGVATLCYLHPRINPSIPFLHAPQYVMIILGMLLISVLVTFWHNRRMFRDSVRKTLKGGEAK